MGVMNSGRTVKRLLNGMGNESTHWRTDAHGMISSTSAAAASFMRCVPHEGHSVNK